MPCTRYVRVSFGGPFFPRSATYTQALPRELRARKELPPVPSFHAQVWRGRDPSVATVGGISRNETVSVMLCLTWKGNDCVYTSTIEGTKSKGQSDLILVKLIIQKQTLLNEAMYSFYFHLRLLLPSLIYMHFYTRTP